MHSATLIAFAFFTGLVGLVTWLITRKQDHESSREAFFLTLEPQNGLAAANMWAGHHNNVSPRNLCNVAVTLRKKNGRWHAGPSTERDDAK